MKLTKIWRKKYKWFLSFISFSLLGAVTLAACNPGAKVESSNQTDQANTNSPAPQEPASSTELKLTEALLEKQTFKRYLSSFSVNIEEAFQIPKNTLQSQDILAPVSGENFKYVFQEFFAGNETVIGNLSGSSSASSGMYQTIGTATDDQSKQTIYGYLVALEQSKGETESSLKNLIEKIKAQLASLVSDLNGVKTKIEVATAKKPQTATKPDYLNRQAAVLLAAQELVKNTNSANWSVLKSNVNALKELVNPVITGLEKVMDKINQLKNDFSNLSQTMGATTPTEISKNTELNSLLNKFSELFLTKKAAASENHEIKLPFDEKASLLTSKTASELLQQLDDQVDFANFFTKIHEKDGVTINLLAQHYNDDVSQDINKLKNDKPKNLLLALTNNGTSEFLKNLKVLRTSLESYKILLGDETGEKSISFAIKQAQEALQNDTSLNSSNKESAEATLTNLTQDLKEFKKQFVSLQTDLERFVTTLAGLEAKTKKIMADLEKAENFGDFLNVVSQAVTLKNEILEINDLVPLLNEDNADNLSSPLNLGGKIKALRDQGTLRKLANQGEQLLKYIQTMPSQASTTLKTVLEKVTNETDVDTKKNKTGVLDQFLYGAADWNQSGTLTYGLNGYQGQKMESHLSNATNLNDFLNNFGTSNQSGLTTLGQLQKLINENYTLTTNPQSLKIMDQIMQAIK